VLAAAVFELFVSVAIALSVDNGTLIGLIVVLSSLPAFAVVALVIPLRYEIWARQLSIVFCFGRRWDIPYSAIEAAEEAQAFRRDGGSAVRFATAPAQAIRIRRRARAWNRPNIVISPQDRAIFLPRLQQALADNPEAVVNG
jgi:hypothetical protein